MDDDETFREVKAKLEILRTRAKRYEDFVSPPDQPPLLWQMAMLADAGFTVLPRVDDPNPHRSFPEITIAMTDVAWGDDYYCLVGGETFAVMAVPASYRDHLMRPKLSEPSYYSDPVEALLPKTYEVEHFQRRDLALSYRGQLRWRSRIMVCVGSRADRH